LMQKIRRWLAIPGRRHPRRSTESFANVRHARRAAPSPPARFRHRRARMIRARRGVWWVPSPSVNAAIVVHCDSDSTSSMAARSGAIVFWRRYYNRHEGMGQPSHQPVVTQCARGITVHDDAAHDVDRLAGRHPRSHAAQPASERRHDLVTAPRRQLLLQSGNGVRLFGQPTRHLLQLGPHRLGVRGEA